MLDLTKALYDHRESAMFYPTHESCYITHLAQQEDRPLISRIKLSS